MRPTPSSSTSKPPRLLPKEPDTPANYDWKTAGPEQRRPGSTGVRTLSESGGEGTERPDASYINPAVLTFETKLDIAQNLRSFGRLALLQGSRLEDQGDFEGALDWYLALLRSTRHCGKRGTMVERLIGIAMHRWASTRLIRWSADPKVDARMLRKALDAAIAADVATPPTSESLKAEYLNLLHTISDPEVMVRLHESVAASNQPAGSPTLSGQGGWKSSLIRVRRRAINEPERSRRVIRLIFANWLAYCDLPPSRQPPKVTSATGHTLTGPASAILGEFFVAGNDAPRSARALPPEKLAQWFGSTMDARMALPAFLAFDKALARERSAQAGLLFNLANALYKREHGQYPEHTEDLVGPYLKALPDGYKTNP